MKKTKLLLTALFAILLMSVLSIAVFASENPVTLDGLQIRISEPYGIRYIANVEGSLSDYDEVGMLIMPTDKLEGELTLETVGAGKISSASGNFNLYAVGDDHFKFTLCVIGLENKHYGVKYSVRPYVVYTEDGVQKTVYCEKYDHYSLSPAKITEKILEMYADEYSSFTASDYDLLDSKLTEYHKYADALAESEGEEEEEIPTETVEYMTLNEFYWTLGTLTSSDGGANPTNKKRMFTPGYIPVDKTQISFDKASGFKYIVMEYDANKAFLSTSGWITTDSYQKKNENAAYYRCVITNDTTFSMSDIPSVTAHLTINVPAVSSGAPVVLDFKKGTITGSNGAVNASSTTRVYTPDLYPAQGLVLNFDKTKDATAVVVLGYNEDGSFVKTYGDKSSSVINVDEIAQGSTHVRFVLKLASGVTSTDETANEIAKCVSASYASQANHSFFELGGIDEAGVGENDSTCIFDDSSEYIHSLGYIPANVTATFDSTIGGQYNVYYYDSACSFLSSKTSLDSATLPTFPEGAAFYRLSVKPGYTITENSCDFTASAFSFAKSYTLTTSDWAVGTISGSTGKESTSNTSRIYTPAYYKADGLTLSYVTNEYASAYVVLAYAADKSFLGTSGDIRSATYDVKSKFPTAEYVRFAIKTNQAMTADTINTVSDNITICESTKLFERRDIEVEAGETIGKFGDEGLVFRFGINSISSVSPGNYQSGMCEVEDEIWLFSTSDKGTAGDGFGVISRYKPDYENGTAEFMGFVKHNFGHANSVDYDSVNKCFIVGNGSGSFSSTENYFYVYKNAYELVKNGAESLEIQDENCITYDWADTGISRMTKLNTCWYGHSSVYVGCNNNGYVYKIALGTGDRILELGEAKQAADDEFNGTWQIIRSYEQPDNYDNAQSAGFRGQGYDQCNQGTDYADGTLYLTCGHDGIYFWRCRLDADGTIKRDEFHKYMVVGSTINTGAISGFICHGDYLLFQNGGYVNVYLNSALK